MPTAAVTGFMGLITNYNLRSMTVRKGTAAMTAAGTVLDGLYRPPPAFGP